MTNYPENYSSTYQLADGTTLTFRPVRPEDADLIQDFVRQLSSQNKHANFLLTFRELTKTMLNKLTHFDFDKAMVLIATHKKNDKETIIALAHYALNSTPDVCDSVVVVADAWQRKGVGMALMNALIQIATDRGLKKMIGPILASNTEMLALARHLGFEISNSDDPTVKNATKQLT